MPERTDIIPPRVPFIDERTGLIAREWYRYLWNQFNNSNEYSDRIDTLEVDGATTVGPDTFATDRTAEGAAVVAAMVDDDVTPVARLAESAYMLGMTSREYEPRRPCYGSFIDTTTQALANVTLAQVIAVGTTLEGRRVALSGGNSVVFDKRGVYSITFSLQFENAGTAIHTARVWLKLNGSDVANSNSYFDIHESHGGRPGAIVGTVNFVTSVVRNDTIQLYWSGTSTDLSIKTYAAGAAPVNPVSPGVILTVTEV